MPDKIIVEAEKNKKKIIVDLFLITSFLFVMYFALNKLGILIEGEQTRAFIKEAGVLAPILFGIIYVVTLIIAPMPGFPFLISAVGLFGATYAIILVYFLDLIGATANFFIAKRFGRPVMRRLIGDRGVRRVDGHAANFGVEVLILSRLFEGFLFEWISYAAGLTNIAFRKYLLITALGSLPQHLITYIFAARVEDLGRLFIELSIVNYILMGVPFIYYFAKKMTGGKWSLKW